jgi:hypothetical protein
VLTQNQAHATRSFHLRHPDQTYVYQHPTDGCTPIVHGDYRRYIREVGREY